MNSYITSLFKPVDISSIVFIRVVFGTLLFLKVGSYIFSGFIDYFWIDPDFHFKYYGFGWVGFIPDSLIYPFVALVAVSALFIALGFLYRISTVIFFLGFTYLFLLEQALYLNHFYLIILIAFLFIFIPANRSFSVDSLIWPRIKSESIDSWCLWILMFQIGVVYFFAGVAKINMDWLHAMPLRIWLEEENFGTPQNRVFFAYLFSYFGLLFDLFVVPLLLYRRTRLYAFLLAVVFHAFNKYLFNIGFFPYISIALTTLYFSPDWPKKLIKKGSYKPHLSKFSTVSFNQLSTNRKILVVFLIAYVSVQIFMPLRHFLYPGNVSWTEEGHKWAWHMKLRDKSGSIRFKIREPITDMTWDLRPDVYLSPRQKRKLATRPDLVIQFAHYIEDQFRAIGHDEVEVRAIARVSLNGRKKQVIIDPNVDLTMQEESILPAKWITPLTTPLIIDNEK